MDLQATQGALAQIRDLIEKVPGPKDPNEAQLHSLLLLGLSIVGELILDVKRIADAAEKMAEL